MNKSKIVVKINFWNGNALIICGLIFSLCFSGIFSKSISSIISTFNIIFIAVTGVTSHYLKIKNGIKPNPFFIFEDERDCLIAYKVMSQLLRLLFTLTFILTLGIVVIPLFITNVYKAILIILLILILIFFLLNLTYYKLWNRYDGE